MEGVTVEDEVCKVRLGVPASQSLWQWQADQTQTFYGTCPGQGSTCKQEKGRPHLCMVSEKAALEVESCNVPSLLGGGSKWFSGATRVGGELQQADWSLAQEIVCKVVLRCWKDDAELAASVWQQRFAYTRNPALLESLKTYLGASELCNFDPDSMDCVRKL
eukprot:11801216-Karenia_brevis.AAC.1